MKYVYILESVEAQHFYVGATDDLRTRINQHNSGQVSHTANFKPWQIKTYLAFSDEQQAFRFEKYLKSASGRAFAKNGSDSEIRLPPFNCKCKDYCADFR